MNVYKPTFIINNGLPTEQQLKEFEMADSANKKYRPSSKQNSYSATAQPTQQV